MTRLVSARAAYRGYATVTVVTLAEAGGEPHEREVVSFGDSACVLPYDPERKVALVVRLPRAPLILRGVEAELVEAPAGMLAHGESAEATARREAMEEVGVALGALEPVATCWPSPGVLAERSHLFLARYAAADRTGAGGGLAEEHESIRVEETPLAALGEACAAGRICDLKTLALVLALKARRPELFF